LARSNADLQQFAYVTSHDLQEPLRAIQAYSQLLRKRYHDRLDSNADEFLGYIITGVQRMHLLIQDLLAYSRVVNLGTRTFVAVQMGEVVHWALLNLQLAIEEAGAVVTCDELPSVLGDHTEMPVPGMSAPPPRAGPTLLPQQAGVRGN
jgi:light-regulated signal transduction histidine kinase (bacteriophytochrome)